MVDGQTDVVERIAYLMCDARCKLPDPRKMLCFIEAFFQHLPLAKFFNHVVEAFGQFTDLIVACHRDGHREVARRNLLEVVYQVVYRQRIALGQENCQCDADRKDHAGGKQTADEVCVLDVADIVEQHVDLDIAKLFVADDNRHENLVRPLGENRGAFALLRGGMQTLFKLLDLAFFADLLRIGGIDDLPFGVDDVYLVDPFFAGLEEVIGQAGGLCLGSKVRNAHLHSLGNLLRTLLDLAHKVVLCILVESEKRHHGQDQQREHDDDKFGVELHGDLLERILKKSIAQGGRGNKRYRYLCSNGEVDTLRGGMLINPTMRIFPGTSLFGLVLGLSLLLSGCTSHVAREWLPYPLTNESFGREVKVVTIPLPVIASSPNEGITAGALAAFLLHDSKDDISTLAAAQVNYNKNFGISSSLYGAFYPQPDRSWEINISKSTKVNQDYEIKLRDKTLAGGQVEVNLFAFGFSDGSARFFGFEAKTPKQRETNYNDQEIGFNLSAGYDIGHHLQIVVGERYRDVEIKQGAVTSVPFIRDRFKENRIPGINGFVAHAQRLAVVYSTLDSLTMPTFGGYARASVENSSKLFGSSADYRHYEGEVKGFIPLDDARYISVFRLMYNQTLGDKVPFLEQSILGGENSLRGYGRNRFIDNSFFLLNLEERIRLFRWEIFNVKADWELAPFIDLGAVMERLDKAKSSQFEFNPGIGLRAVVRPNIVGRIDVGIGHDGPAVFVGLGYPF